MINPQLNRREYPEVSFAAVGSYVYGVAGIQINAPMREVTVAPALAGDVKWFSVQNCPLLDGEADVSCENQRITFKNRTSQLISVNGIQVLPNTAVEFDLQRG